jgi:hypothetical protein
MENLWCFSIKTPSQVQRRFTHAVSIYYTVLILTTKAAAKPEHKPKGIGEENEWLTCLWIF